MSDNPNENYAGRSFTTLLDQLGKIVIKNTSLNDWMDCEMAASICRQHNLTINGRAINAEELEAILRKLFWTLDEIDTDCVKVVASVRRVGWDLVFQIRFHRSNPRSDGPGVLEDLLELDKAAAIYLPVNPESETTEVSL